MSATNRNAVDRITVLWAVTECGLGGFFHAMQSPFTGLLVGGLSVTYISLIAWHCKQGNNSQSVSTAIFKAALTVIVAKAIISPHSPVGAYLAVSLQALLGILFYSIIPSFNLSAVLLGIVATSASAVQKVFVLWIVFGQPFFDAIDQFSNSVSERFIGTSLSFSLSYLTALTYVSIYAIGGLIIGVLITRIPSSLIMHQSQLKAVVTAFQKADKVDLQPKKSHNWVFALILSLLLIAFVFQFFVISPDAAFLQLIRTVGILGLWFIIVQPIVKWTIHRYSKNHSEASEERLSLIRSEIPIYLSLAKHAWRNAHMVDQNRLLAIVLILLHYTLNER
ncbi:MAG: hypothetical protein Salg2KO_20060 [Salibacteraceae bacterium]